MAIVKLLFLLTFFVYINSIEAASFDCAKAENKIELMICSNKNLSQHDDWLAKYYKDALVNTDTKNALKTEQQLWLKNTRDKCADYNCLENAYLKRELELQEWQHFLTYFCDQRKSIFFVSVGLEAKPTTEANYDEKIIDWVGLMPVRKVVNDGVQEIWSRMTSKVVSRQCGLLEIRFKGGALIGNPNGPYGAVEFPLVELRKNNKIVLPETALYECELPNKEGFNPFYHCPDGYAQSIESTVTPKNKLKITVHRNFLDPDENYKELERTDVSEPN